MSDSFDISFVIVGETVDDPMYSRIIEEARQLNGAIISILHAAGTNTIDVSAHWDQFEIDEKIERIKKIANVKDVIIHKKQRVVKRTIPESTVEISDSVVWDIKKDPIGEVTRAKDARDYYKAVSLSCTFFQFFGKKVLLWHSQNTGTTLNTNELTWLKRIIDALYGRNLIDKTIRDEMHDVRELRNEFQHEDRGLNFSSGEAKEAEGIIAMALNCIKYLKTKYGNIQVE